MYIYIYQRNGDNKTSTVTHCKNIHGALTDKGYEDIE